MATPVVEERMGAQLLTWHEGDLAVKYAEVACAECLDGTCEKVGSDHDLDVYWKLPAEVRRQMVAEAADAIGNCSAMDAAWDVLATVAERHAVQDEPRPEDRE